MKNNFALVTGAGTRLGYQIARHLITSGFDIIAHFNRSENGIDELRETAKNIGRNMFPLQADLSTRDGIEDLIEQAKTLIENGEIALVVHSAAIMSSAELNDLSYEHISLLEHVNFIAPTLITSALIPKMSDSSNVIMISDIAASQLWLKYPVYSITKTQLESIAGRFAKALAPKTRVNTIALGLVLRSTGESEDVWEKRIERTPMNRTTSMKEITDAIDLIISSNSMTGNRIVLDSGTSLL